ncbi:Sugar-specific transcriptional regulator TrmB [Mycolicibacterium conceptionense]|uniref:Sugar-specific transcriptional regulator TrmB n=1 Tax=Mycolicibacterium conceptionense TaxID=451644 RepID=A0A0U1DNY3_9MYCO|nr:helix-turn-helix domain-containing protein [Mycolicibacterium conceptionense]ORV25524.1 hypothetical protein AWB98_18020 [Mycolicibacterium conceptionense]CQD20021.1 Sugar-specific transcriptional regulator TrmB [Mycolicibacterium conceptionense]
MSPPNDSRPGGGDGFTQYPNRLFGVLLPIQGATYVQLRRHKNKHDGSHPSVDTVAKAVGKPQRTVERAIRALVEAEEIRRESRGQNRPCRNHFRAVPDADGKETFTKVPNWVLDRGLSPAALMVYVTVLEVHEVSKTLRVEDIARKCRAGTDTVNGAVEELERRRLIKVRSNRFRCQRKQYEILPRQPADMDLPEVAVHQTPPDVDLPEVAVHLPEVAVHLPEVADEKDSLQKDSSEKDSTSPLGGLTTAVQGQTLNQSHGDGQELAAVGDDFENSPGFLEFLERKKSQDPHGSWDGTSLRRRFALTEYRRLLESEESPDIPVPALDTVTGSTAHGLESHKSALGGLEQRLAQHREPTSDSRGELQQRHKQDLAQRLANHR